MDTWSGVTLDALCAWIQSLSMRIRVPDEIEAGDIIFDPTTQPTCCHINYLYVLVATGDVWYLVQANLE